MTTPLEFIAHPHGGKILTPLQYPDTYDLTLDEIHEHFVIQAPDRERRERLFLALQLYCLEIWDSFPSASIWVNGSFSTYKAWGPPNDVDIAVGVSVQDIQALQQNGSVDFIAKLESLQTRSVEMNGQNIRVQPGFGLIDGFVYPQGLDPEPTEFGEITQEQYWYFQWSRVRGKDSETLSDLYKGFIKVVKQ